MVQSIQLSGARIDTQEAASSMHLSDGLITSFGQAIEADVSFEFPPTYHIVPGLIDMHIHGVKNADVMDASFEALKTISQALGTEGVTGFLATTMTASLADIENTLAVIHDYRLHANHHGARLLGVHLEGPFLSADKMGAQIKEHLLLPHLDLLKKWHAQFPGTIKLVTLAPELPQALECIRYLTSVGIIASIGHTDATFEQSQQAIEAGCTHATHLFNAMRGIHHREPGAVTAILLADSFAELIVDGFHLHPAIVSLAIKIKGVERIVLVTDAMRAKCMPDGCYDLGGQAVYVQDDQARLQDGTLAGSVLTMASALQNTLAFTGCTLSQAVQMASTNPARALALFAECGSLAVGKRADVVVLDDKLNVVLTIVGGEVVFDVLVV